MRRAFERKVILWKAAKVGERTGAELFDRPGLFQAPPVPHDRPEQRLGLRIRFVKPSDKVVVVLLPSPRSGVLGKAEDLLAAGPISLLLAKFGLGFGLATAFDFNQLVNDAERGNVARSGKVRADAPNVNGRALADELSDAEFVQIAAGDNLGLCEPVPVEDLPHLAALFEQVAAVKAHSGDLAANSQLVIDWGIADVLGTGLAAN